MYGRPESRHKLSARAAESKNKKGLAAVCRRPFPSLSGALPLGFNGSLALRGRDPEPDQAMLRTKVAPNDRSLVRAKPRLIVTDIGSPPFAQLTMEMRVGAVCP